MVVHAANIYHHQLIQAKVAEDGILFLTFMGGLMRLAFPLEGLVEVEMDTELAVVVVVFLEALVEIFEFRLEEVTPFTILEEVAADPLTLEQIRQCNRE
jgi:hypothetical protein